jgi:hypothetical protein
MKLSISLSESKRLILIFCLIFALPCNFAFGQTIKPSPNRKATTGTLLDDPQAALFAEKINRLAQGLLPFQFDIESSAGTTSPMTLVDVLYCSANSASSAKLLAIGHPGPPPPKRPTRTLVKADCSATLAAVAAKALAANDAPDWVAASEILASWSPWKLNLNINDVDTAEKSTATTHPPQDLKSQLQNGGQPFKTIDISKLKLAIEGVTESYNLAVRFIGENIFLLMVPAAEVPGFNLQEFLAMDTSILNLPTPANSSLILKLPYSYTTKLLNTDLKGVEFVIQRAADGSPRITVRSLGISGSTDTFTMTGILHDIPDVLDVNATNKWIGSDLKLNSVSFVPILDSCNGLPPGEKLKCINTLRFKATIFATAIITRYRGTPLRPIGPDKPIPTVIQGKPYNLRFVVLRSQSATSAIIFYADFVLEGT